MFSVISIVFNPLQKLLLQPGYGRTTNPYHKTTFIKYYVPLHATSAELKVFCVTGVEVYSQELSVKEEVELSAERFVRGTFLYHLIINGQSVANKKLVLIK